MVFCLSFHTICQCPSSNVHPPLKYLHTGYGMIWYGMMHSEICVRICSRHCTVLNDINLLFNCISFVFWWWSFLLLDFVFQQTPFITALLCLWSTKKISSDHFLHTVKASLLVNFINWIKILCVNYLLHFTHPSDWLDFTHPSDWHQNAVFFLPVLSSASLKKHSSSILIWDPDSNVNKIEEHYNIPLLSTPN